MVCLADDLVVRRVHLCLHRQPPSTLLVRVLGLQTALVGAAQFFLIVAKFHRPGQVEVRAHAAVAVEGIQLEEARVVLAIAGRRRRVDDRVVVAFAAKEWGEIVAIEALAKDNSRRDAEHEDVHGLVDDDAHKVALRLVDDSPPDFGEIEAVNQPVGNDGDGEEDP